MKRKISISTGLLQVKFGNSEMLKIVKNIGADAIDFDLTFYSSASPKSIYSKSDAEIVEYFTNVRKEAESLGIEIAQTHGRITGFKNDKEHDDRLIEDARIDCLVTKTLGAPICVIHSVTTIFMGPEAPGKLMHDLNFDMFTRILPYAREQGIVIASETFGDATGLGCCDFFGNINEFIMSYNKVCAVEDFAKYFKYCVDTGHSNKATRYNNNPSSADVIRMLGGNIVCLHLNDNDTLTDQHKTPFTGTIDWNDVFNALDEVGYDGICNCEVSFRHFGEDFCVEEAAFCVKVMRHYIESRYGKE